PGTWRAWSSTARRPGVCRSPFRRRRRSGRSATGWISRQGPSGRPAQDVFRVRLAPRYTAALAETPAARSPAQAGFCTPSAETWKPAIEGHMPKDVILTPEGLSKLKDELEVLSTEKRREVAERIKEAREFGDISENSEYDDAKNEQ